MKPLTTDLSNMTHTQLIEGYVELNLNIEEEEARTGVYPTEIARKLFEWMKVMRFEDLRKGEEVLSNIRSSRAMGNL